MWCCFLHPEKAVGYVVGHVTGGRDAGSRRDGHIGPGHLLLGAEGSSVWDALFYALSFSQSSCFVCSVSFCAFCVLTASIYVILHLESPCAQCHLSGCRLLFGWWCGHSALILYLLSSVLRSLWIHPGLELSIPGSCQGKRLSLTRRRPTALPLALPPLLLIPAACGSPPLGLRLLPNILCSWKNYIE